MQRYKAQNLIISILLCTSFFLSGSRPRLESSFYPQTANPHILNAVNNAYPPLPLPEGPDDPWFDYHHIVIKFKPETHARLRGDAIISVTGVDLTPVQDLLSQQSGISIHRRFSLPEDELEAQRNQVIQNRGNGADLSDLPDLNLYYSIQLDETVSFEKAMQLIETLAGMKAIETVFANPVPAPATLPAAKITPVLTDEQVYLNDAPLGIGARPNSWGQPGGKGAGIQIIDIEGGWIMDHEDLGLNPADLINGVNSTDSTWYNHGSAVLGELRGIENGIGITGIVPQADVRVSSVFGENNSIANAINVAISQSNAGDVILIELHILGPDSGETCICNCSQFELIPVEYYPDVFDVIQLATLNGITIVEAAGNGSMNLDNSIYKRAFDPTYRDSGAIIVGASTSSAPHQPMCWTNYGSRVDAYAWGENVVTAGYGDRFLDVDTSGNPIRSRTYTATFSGTSSATPIVAGSAAALQSMTLAQSASPLNPLVIRRKLRQTGTPQNPVPKHIGNLPDISAAFAYSPPAAAALTLTAPLDGAETTHIPILVWNADPDSIQYDLQVSSQADFNNLIVDAAVSMPHYAFSAPLLEGTYYWRARGYPFGMAGAWSAPRQFTSHRIAPAAPILLTPANREIVKGITADLDWEDNSPGSVVYYRTQISRRADFSSTFIDEYTTESCLTLAEADSRSGSILPPNATLYWRVQTILGDMNSEWSPVWKFYTTVSAPVLLTPAEYVQSTDTRPKFSWHKTQGANAYQILLSLSPHFDAVYRKTTTGGSSYRPSSDLPRGENIYWKVRARGRYGWGEFSESQFYSADPPTKPHTLSPSGVIYTYLPDFDWDDSTGIVDEYQIQISNSKSFKSTNIDEKIERDLGTGQINSFYKPLAELPAGSYYWRVRAISSHPEQYSDWSKIKLFKTPATITGSVFDKNTDLPLVGATVQLKNTIYTAATDLNGSYTINGIKSGRYTLLIEMDGYIPIRRSVTIRDGTIRKFYSRMGLQ